VTSVILSDSGVSMGDIVASLREMEERERGRKAFREQEICLSEFPFEAADL